MQIQRLQPGFTVRAPQFGSIYVPSTKADVPGIEHNLAVQLGSPDGDKDVLKRMGYLRTLEKVHGISLADRWVVVLWDDEKRGHVREIKDRNFQDYRLVFMTPKAYENAFGHKAPVFA